MQKLSKPWKLMTEFSTHMLNISPSLNTIPKVINILNTYRDSIPLGITYAIHSYTILFFTILSLKTIYLLYIHRIYS